MSTFYNNLLKQCSIKKVSPSSAAHAAGLSRAAASGWKKGSEPSDVNLKKLADYFGCSVSDLIGEPQEEPKNEKIPPQSDGIDVSMLINDRAELKRLVDRLTPDEVEYYLAEIRKTILGG